MLLLILISQVQAVRLVSNIQREPRLGHNPCGYYQCATDDISMAADQCIRYQNDTHYIKPCEYGYCEPTIQYDSYCNATVPHDYPEPYNYVGAFCNSTMPCYKSTCVNEICQGKTFGDACTDTEECGFDMFCRSGSCKAAFQVGDSGCRGNFECTITAACNHTNGSLNGDCLEYFSIEVGEYVTDCFDGVSLLWETGSCQNSRYYSDHGICIEAPTVIGNYPLQCHSDVDCIGESDQSTGKEYFEGTCDWGMNSIGQSVCQPFLGDDAATDYIAQLKSYLSTSNLSTICNSARRFEYECVKTALGDSFSTFQNAELFYSYFTTIYLNDECTKTVYTPYYWYAMSGILTAGAILLLN